MNVTAFVIFLAFVVVTLGITTWASRRSSSRSDFYTAGGNITGFQNGLAFSGDFLSAAALLGVAGLYYQAGMDGLIYGLGALIGWPALLFLFADRLRKLGRFTLTDVLSSQLSDPGVRIFASVANLIVLLFYMVSQVVAAGLLVDLLLGIDFTISALLVGALMICYVVFGGMVATTWVQITKAALLIFAAFLLGFLVLLRFDFDIQSIFTMAMDKHPAGEKIMAPGGLVTGTGAAISLGLTLMFGPAGLPHILMRFFTVPNAAEARKSALIAILIIGSFCFLMIIIGFGAIALLSGDPAFLDETGNMVGGGNMVALHLADALGGNLMLGFVSAVAFATILAVVAGITLAAAATISHDIYSTLVKKGAQTEAEELRVSRWAAVGFGVVSIALSLAFQHENVTFLSVFAFAIAASATFPILLLCLFWKGLTGPGAVWGGVAGLLTALILLILGPSIWVSVLGHDTPVFPYQYPTIVAMPTTFVVAFIVSMIGRSQAVPGQAETI
ncbi:sodium:solute symporter family transporter [Hyphomonas johnsonii]|uniref:Cation/acetate symporter ActP n=1 Tax=Hyphomonas johnsonii MHS-2 TaxID=1280950 RepID=A0A059FBB9_9PROT|nr:sodium/solute symporter [Hyphomonas johnsonii]KCZ87905.1 Cation/acetate symporter ActP [Hyphomonas johnsonii MHS-2]